MKNLLAKIIFTLAVAFGSAPTMASDLNTMCTVLNQFLPGNVTLVTGLTGTDNHDYSQKAIIKPMEADILSVKTKEGTSVVKLINIGAGESSTCLLSFSNNGLQAKLVDMDDKMTTFLFEEKGRSLKLVITKK